MYHKISILLLTILCIISSVSGSHFRYGTINWVQGVEDDTMTFYLKVAFRYSFFDGEGLVVGSTFTYGDMYADFWDYFWLWGWDYDYDTWSPTFVVNHIDLVGDWMTCEYIDTLTFPMPPNAKADQTPAVVSYYYDARLSNLKNNADAYYNIWSSFPIKSGRINQASPVSGMLPVVPAYYGETNYIKVLAYDINTLGFALSTPTQMGGSSLTQPPGLSVSADGIITYNPTSTGLWCTQIKAYETNGFNSAISIDFILNVTVRPVTPDLPPFFIPQTPDPGSYVPMMANILNTFPLVGKSPQATSTVAISIASVPTGMVSSPQVNNANIGTIQMSWTPTISQIGIYVFSTGLVDSKGIEMNGGVRSFFLNVTAPACGNGVPQNGICNCTKGWSGPKCDQCAPGYYGPNCVPIPPCYHGSANGGIYGDGKCICDPGWNGPACNVSVIQRCSPSNPNSIVTSTTNPSKSVNPDFVKAYLTQTSTAALQVPLGLYYKDVIRAEIFLLYDLTVPTASQARYKQFIDYHANFKAYLLSKRETFSFGLGTFTDSTGQPNSFQLLSNFGNNGIDPVLSTLKLINGSPLANIPYTVLIDAISKIAFSASNTMKIIYLITDNNLAPTDQTLITQLNTALDNRNVLLGIYALDSVTSYVPLTTLNKAAIAYPWLSTDTWFNVFVDKLYVPMATNTYVKVKSDPYRFVNVPPTSPSTTTTWYSNLTIPATPVTATYPQINLNVVGYDSQTIAVSFNHPPTTNDVFLTSNEDTPISFSILGNDIDLNPLTISFTTLPAGTVTINGVTVDQGTSYPLPNITTNAFQYTPAANFFGVDVGVFNVFDGCVGVNGKLNVTVQAVNDAPTCTSVSITTDQHTEKTINVAIADIDSASLTVSFSGLTNLANLGTLSIGGSPVVDGTAYTSPSSVVFTPLLTASGSASIPFIGRDGSLSVQCQLSITVNRVNDPPVLSVQSPQVTVPASAKMIPFTFSDTDNNEKITVSITSITPVNGYFMTSSNATITSASIPLSFPAVDISTTHTGSDFIWYVSANSNDVGVSVTIQIVDNNGGSDQQTVSIQVVGNRANVPPVATPAGPIVLNEGSISPVFLLNGTDADQTKFDNVLNVFISVNPQYGILLASDGASDLPATLSTPLYLTYLPNNGYFGSDSIQFYVTDSLGAISNTRTVQFTIQHVNHAPTVQAPDIYSSGKLGDFPPVKFTVVSSDIDGMDTLTVTLLELPSSGSILDSTGAVCSLGQDISTQPISYLPPTNIYNNFNTNYSVKVCDNGTPVMCDTSTATIHFTFLNTPPSGVDLTVNGNQSTPVTFQLVGSDPEFGTNGLTFTFSSLPVSGQLFDSNGVPITSTTQVLTNTTITYLPSGSLSDADTPGRLGPLDSFYYIVTDRDGGLSVPNVVRVFVRPYRPPVYDGSTEFNTNEDTKLPMHIAATSPDGGLFEMRFLYFTGRGQLLDKDGNPLNRSLLSNGLDFFYMPPPNENGNHFDTINFTLIGQTDQSPVYTIYINVIPVNDGPVIIPMTFTNSTLVDTQLTFLVTSVSMYVNTSAILVFNASDIDSPYTSLVAKSYSRLRNSNMYSLGQPTASRIELGDVIPRSEDGLWRVTFTPFPGRFGKPADKLIIGINDNFNMSSAIYYLSVNVVPINIPPVVYVDVFNWNTDATVPLGIYNVSIDDPDSEFNNISLTLKLVGGDNQGSVGFGYNAASRYCTFQGTSVSCLGPKKVLNYILSSQIIVNIPHSGTYTLQVTVNDLGWVTGPALSDTKSLTINVNDVPVSKPRNTVVLSAAIAASAAVAAIIAFGVWRYLKSRTPPTDAFFGDSPFSENNVSSNPLYQHSSNSGFNPLYQDINS